ncbi:hypothetical protein [Staphylococcus gallinarum]|uniref:hypothetical protein n=1 Tax=Staphylococcus gallinarum TaxID=1293 RepID=UPI0030C5F7DE
MKKFFITLATLILIGILGLAIYVYNHPKVIDNLTDNNKKEENQKISNVDNKEDSSNNVHSGNGDNQEEYDVTTLYNQSLMHQNKDNLSGQSLNEFNAIWAQLMEHERNGTLTEAEANIIADQQAIENSKENNLPVSSGVSSKQQIEFNEKIAKEEEAKKKNDSTNQEEAEQQVQQQDKKQEQVQKNEQTLQSQQNDDNTSKTNTVKQQDHNE